MEWTTDPPTRPGLYAWKPYHNARAITVILEIDYNKLKVVYPPDLINTTAVLYATDIHGEWSGPISKKS